MTISEPPVPRFFATAASIAADFLDNSGYTAETLPPVRVLAEKYGVSKGTVEKAMGWLSERGRISGEIGRGTFINRGKANAEIQLKRVVILAARYGRVAGHYLGSITQGIQEFALKRGLEVVTLMLDPVPSRRRLAAERGRLMEPGTGAVVIHSDPSIKDLLADLDAFACPLVLVGNQHFGDRVSVGLDDGDGIRQIRDHLHERGKRRPVFLGTEAPQWPHQARRRAFAENMGPREILCREPGLTLAIGHRLAGEALAAHADLDALVCVNDRMALGAVIRLREEGRAIPKQVAVTGFDDDPTLVEDFIPPITSVGYDGRELGRRALMALLGQKVDPVLPVNLVARASTAKVRG